MAGARNLDVDAALVVVGGVDPGGGAGLLRDVATARALNARVWAVGTAWTEQGPDVHRVEPRAPTKVRGALARAIAELRPQAVKIGMAVGPPTARALLAALADFDGHVVVDPVLATSRGGALWSAKPADLFPLLRRATLVTPNGPEAAALAGRAVTSPADAAAAGRVLVADVGLAAVLVKGGHLRDQRPGRPEVIADVLETSAATTRFIRPRTPGPSPRGTGCALATAIAVELARGTPLAQAITAAGDWLGTAIAAARRVGGELHLGF